VLGGEPPRAPAGGGGGGGAAAMPRPPSLAALENESFGRITEGELLRRIESMRLASAAEEEEERVGGG
jgi:hypothetical protein